MAYRILTASFFASAADAFIGSSDGIKHEKHHHKDHHGTRGEHRHRHDRKRHVVVKSGNDSMQVGLYGKVLEREFLLKEDWLNLHDGPIKKYNGIYFWYGMQYGDCTMNYAKGSLKAEFENLWNLPARPKNLNAPPSN